MTQPIDPASGAPVERRAQERRTGERRSKDRRAATVKGGLPAVIEGEEARPAAPPPPEAGSATFAAQLMGQKGQTRGLKGGPPVLDQARATYLETEWRGPADRRLPAGKLTKTQI